MTTSENSFEWMSGVEQLSWDSSVVGASSQLDELKSRAGIAFRQSGFPTTRHEDWRYTNLASIGRRKLIPSSTIPDIDITEIADSWVSGVAGPRVVLVNGRLRAELSSELGGSSGLRIFKISELLRTTSAELKTLRERVLAGVHIAHESNALVDLNTALFSDGVVVWAAEGYAGEESVQILNFQTAESSDVGSYSRAIFAASPNAKIRIIESYRGPHWSGVTSAVSQVFLAERSQLTHIKIQAESETATHLSVSFAELSAKSSFQSYLYNFGSSLSRNEIRPIFLGSEAECLMYGLTAIDGNQHVDNFTVINHAVPNCFSREIYKGIYAGRSKGVFSGTIVVDKDAQKTNAIQSNRSLLLSDEASIETRPQLKIWADDVKCTHGATVGQLDDDALFYIRARGIPRDAARNILIHAFASEVIDEITDIGIRRHLEELLLAKLQGIERMDG